MNKTIKGASAAVAAGVLLLGGAGSLAYWEADEEVQGRSIASGQLKLADTDTCATVAWKLNGGTYTEPAAQDDPVTTEVDERVGTLIVPGDTLTKGCSFTIEAAGDNLQADLTVIDPTESGSTGLTDELTVDGAFTVAGGAVSQITDADHGDTLEATITVEFPFGTVVDNDSQNGTVTIGSYTVTATQTNATP